MEVSLITINLLTVLFDRPDKGLIGFKVADDATGKRRQETAVI